MTQNLARHGALIALVGALAYGSNIAPAGIAQDAGITAAQLSLWRSVFLVASFVGVMLIWRTNVGQVRPLQAIAIGFFSSVLGLSYISAIQFIPVALAIVILYTYPILVILFEAVLDRKMPPLWRIGLCLVALLGIALAAGSSIDSIDWRGLSLAVVSSIGAAILNLMLDRFGSAGISEIAAIQVVVSVIASIVLVLEGSSFNPSALMAAPVAALSTNIGYAIGFVATVVAAPLIGATRMSLIFLIEPVAGIMSAALLLDQWPGAIQWIGVVIILMALAVDAMMVARRKEINHNPRESRQND
jgi:drug/metabolite transporter (DMT)-like permease